ncbi:MAG: 50S ribosomal protein L22 [Elusimicrobiota bacterium]
MATAKAQTKYVRMSPSKINVVLDRIRGKKVEEAYRILQVTNKRAARPVKKTLDSAVANSESHGRMEGLRIKTAWSGPGPSLKRLKPRAMGRADIYKRRTAHIKIEVEQ